MNDRAPDRASLAVQNAQVHIRRIRQIAAVLGDKTLRLRPEVTAVSYMPPTRPTWLRLSLD
jgi:hypothetical protein